MPAPSNDRRLTATKGPYRTMTARKTLAELPKRLRTKIELSVPGADERHVCWHWTGAFTPPRHRYRAYEPRETRETFGDKIGSFRRDRGTPNCHSPSVGYPIPAHREVYACTFDIPTRDVPSLNRCSNDLCVSPWHVRPQATGRRRAAGAASDRDRFKRVMAVLQAKRPEAELSANSAADECGIPLADLTPDIWKAYGEWALANPEQDDL